MTYVIVDFEATCCDHNTVPREEMEIIEIGAVAVNKNSLNIQDEFQKFVRPSRQPILTTFCTQLTTITQDMVNEANSFNSVLREFSQWIESFDDPVFCSWGFYDKKQLKQDCDFHNLDFPFTEQHINIKKEFALKMGLRKGVGLGKALNLVKLNFQGTAHRGIDDAKNMARISNHIFTRHTSPIYELK